MILGAPTSLELSSEAQGPDARAEAQERPASGQVLTATLGVRWAVNIQGSGQGKRLDDDIMSVFHLTLSKCYLSKLKLGQHSVPAIEKKTKPSVVCKWQEAGGEGGGEKNQHFTWGAVGEMSAHL